MLKCRRVPVAATTHGSGCCADCCHAIGMTIAAVGLPAFFRLRFMSNFYQRYLAGDHEATWSELVACGPEIFIPPLATHAQDVANEIVDRAFHNLTLIYARLIEFGYEFANDPYVLREATATDQSALHSVEITLGRFPAVLHNWYERVASVDFTQSRRQLFAEGDDPSTVSAVSGLGLNITLVFRRISECLRHRDDLAREGDLECREPQFGGHFFPTGGVATNCEYKGTYLPSHGFDDPLYNEGAGWVRFVEELRKAFRWGGFPCWGMLFNRRRLPTVVPHAPQFLKLLPMLKEGLKPL